MTNPLVDPVGNATGRIVPIYPQSEKVRISSSDLATWIEEIGRFINFINGVDGNSVQSQLAASSCNTLFEKISNSEKKRLARVAMELSSLNESLKGYLISGDEA